ncbi:MAG: hypothetical protein JSS72_07075 [Armatimonadetes bacterium]|nr:hypothetical protein [Armatimonadota bacterium]
MAVAKTRIDPSPVATLRLSRLSKRDIGFREAVIYLDGIEVANLAYEDDLTLSLPPGQHAVYVHNRLRKSKTIKFFAERDEVIHIEVGNKGNWLFALMMVLIQIGPPTVFIRLLSHTRASIGVNSE